MSDTSTIAAFDVPDARLHYEARGRGPLVVLVGALGIEPTLFPGDHIGFAEEPAAFAVRLREVLGAG